MSITTGYAMLAYTNASNLPVTTPKTMTGSNGFVAATRLAAAVRSVFVSFKGVTRTVACAGFLAACGGANAQSVHVTRDGIDVTVTAVPDDAGAVHLLVHSDSRGMVGIRDHIVLQAYRADGGARFVPRRPAGRRTSRTRTTPCTRRSIYRPSPER